MSSSKSKNIIIIILLLLNLILLMVVVFDKAEEGHWNIAEADAMKDVLTQSGIELEQGIALDIKAPSPCVIIRDPASEKELISNILGDVRFGDLGGSIYYYESETGQAVFRGTGETDIVFTGQLPELDGSDGKSVANYMEKRGLMLAPDSAILDGTPENPELSIPCAFDGNCVYNAKLNFTIADNRILMINGTTVFDGQQTLSDEAVMDCVSALMRFIEIVHDEGYICSRITGLEAGYFMSVSALGECSLSPVWQITTDTGELYINAVSGKIESLPT